MVTRLDHVKQQAETAAQVHAKENAKLREELEAVRKNMQALQRDILRIEGERDGAVKEAMHQAEKKEAAHDAVMAMAIESKESQKELQQYIQQLNSRLCPKKNFLRHEKLRRAYVQVQRTIQQQHQNSVDTGQITSCKCGGSYCSVGQLEFSKFNALQICDVAGDEEEKADIEGRLLNRVDTRKTPKQHSPREEPRAQRSQSEDTPQPQRSVTIEQSTQRSLSFGEDGAGGEGDRESRATNLQAFKSRRITAMWFLNLEAQSQRLHGLTDGATVIASDLTGRGAGLLGSLGCTRPPRSRDRILAKLVNDFAQNSTREIELKIKLCPPGKQPLVVRWYDDLTRFFGKKLWTQGDQLIIHNLAVGAVKVVYVDRGRQPGVHSSPASNPEGYSRSTSIWILNQTMCGKHTWRDFLEHRLGSLQSAWGQGSAHWCTAAGIANAVGRFDYGQQAGVVEQRSISGIVPDMLLSMNLKSFQEVGRCLMQSFRHKSLVRIALVNNEYIPILGDHPVYLMTETFRNQADTFPGCDSRRGLVHLGQLIIECCRGTSGGALEPMGELVDVFHQHCNELLDLPMDCGEEELARHVGQAISRLICAEPGPLHQKLNPLKDLITWWRPLFEGMFKHLTGTALPSTPTARLTALLGQVLLAAWEKLRKGIMRKSEAQLASDRAAGIGANFFLVSITWFMESSLPSAILHYELFIRGGARGTTATEADGDFDLKKKSMAFAAQEAGIRGRHNYFPALTKALDTLLYWGRVHHPLYSDCYGVLAPVLDEFFGET
jgi:hypothetical protein